MADTPQPTPYPPPHTPHTSFLYPPPGLTPPPRPNAEEVAIYMGLELPTLAQPTHPHPHPTPPPHTPHHYYT